MIYFIFYPKTSRYNKKFCIKTQNFVKYYILKIYKDFQVLLPFELKNRS